MSELSGRPLVDTAVDARLYVRRREHSVLAKSARQSLNVLLTGPRGSGKTTLLRQLLLELREAGQGAVFVDGKLAADALSFLELVRMRVAEAPELSPILREHFARPPGPTPHPEDDSGRLLRLIDQLAAVDAEIDRVALLVDGLPSPEVGHSLFGRLRDELWQLPFSWQIAVDDRERAALMEPPADAFFDRQINLSPMTGAEQLKLLGKRMTVANRAALEPLVAASDGSPRVLLALARDTLEGGRGTDDLLVARAQREAAASKLGRPASMLLAELESMGSASASDEELLKRMGWTRPRAAQVFGELEKSGLVTSRETKGHGGRPRKVYFPLRGAPEE